MSPRLSIIVPVFNVFDHLRQCLLSLSEQGLYDYEVILVNDASRDNSRGICAEWCATHPAFRLINHSENRGLSEARNTGISHAQGEYITFVDSDDFLATDTLARVWAQMGEEVDVIEYPVRVGHLGKSPYTLTFSPRDIDYTTWMREAGHEHCYAWNKIYRKSLWTGMEFPPKRHYEDIFTIPYILRRARLIRQTDIGLYYYCYRKGSICQTPSAHNLYDYVSALACLLRLPENRGNNKLILRARNAERSYRQVSHSCATIVQPRHTAFCFAFSKGLTWHDRLKTLYYSLF